MSAKYNTNILNHFKCVVVNARTEMRFCGQHTYLTTRETNKCDNSDEIVADVKGN